MKMSFRFNPVALLTRRRSKSKTRTESTSESPSVSRSIDNSEQAGSFEPQTIIKPAKSGVGTELPSTTPKPRFRVFSSFHRARSPRRPQDSIKKQSSKRGASVPPVNNNNFKATFGESENIVQHSEVTSHGCGSESPAPLAQSDCFELTDVSEPETEELKTKKDIDDSGQVTSSDLDAPEISSPEETKRHSLADQPFSEDSVDGENTQQPCDTEREEDDDSEDTWTLEGTAPTIDYEVDSSVPKLNVEYETEYPVCEISDSILSIADDTFEDEGVQSESTQTESSDKVDGEKETQTLPEEQSLQEELDEGLISDTVEPTPKLDDYEIVQGIDTIMDHNEEQTVDNTEENMDGQYAAYSEVAQQEIERTEDNFAPQFEVEPDPSQDPFYAVELAATEPQSYTNSLTTPSIIVTSESTGSLHIISETEPLEPPSRPPPPAPERAPKRPAAPAVVPSKPPPPRPGSQPPPGKPAEHKKKKLFGVVDLSPLPSDPDPNFPFRKHLEKSVVPNPKKAIQRIIRGETKAERRQRKEHEELNRLLRSSGPVESQPIVSKSTEWEEFHQLTAQIEHTVQETASKVKTIAPVQVRLHPLEEDEDTDEPESWAKFETIFGSQAEPAAVSVEDPWKEAENQDSTAILFDLTEEETQTAQQDQEVWPGSNGPELDSNIACTTQDQPTDLFSKLETEREGELQTEDSTDNFKQELLENIDSFLGINVPSNQLIQPEPLSSDPLEVLERLRPEPEVNPLEELGLNLQSPSMGTKPVTESDLSSEFEDSITQFHRQESQGDASQVSSKDMLKDDEAESIKDESGFEILQSAEPEPIDTTSDDQQSEIHQGIQLPEVDEQDPSDLDDVTTLDDVLWGGFGEVRASQTDQDRTISSPFGADDFSKLPAPIGTSQIPSAYQVDVTTVRPRHKPVRQETLSGNNPFRKRSSIDQTAGDELAKAAAGIELVGIHKVTHKKRDSFESSDSSTAGDKVQVAAEDNIDVALTPNNFPVTDGTLFKTTDSGFDPLQTIYPESDNESVTSGEQGFAEKEAPFTISINEKLPNSVENGETVPTLKAPPRPVAVVHVIPEPKVEPELHEPQTQEIVVKQETPAGWVDFASESIEFADDVDRPVVPADAAFEVDWASTVTRNEPVEPEPPRPDTPDPELDKPFHSPAEDGVYYRLWLRFPEKKTRVKQVSKYTTDRYWREIAVRFSEEHNRKVINLHEIDEKSDEPSPEPYRSIRIEPYMQLSREKLQQYDKYGKLHVFKLNHVSYRELVGIRPEKFTIKNLQHLVTHKPKQNLAVDHLPVYTEILKFGSLDQQRIRSLMPVFEDALMRIATHKDATLSYNREEVCCYVVDEYQAKVSSNGSIQEQKARTRILCTAFVNGGPHIVLGLNDKWRYGREVVRRSDILPVMHDEWISIRNPEFHSCVELEAYEKDHMLKFYPLDGCRFELIRFRVSLRGHRELPMQTKTTYAIDGRRVSMRCELLVPGFFSASHRKGAVPCENVEIHIPVPEDWIYHFRVEKHHKYGSVHSTLRKPGRIKGLERITQMAQSLLPPSILEASIGLAKYEHLYKAIVWRIGRIPDKHEASLRPHLLTCKLTLAQHDTVPEWETLVPDCQIEYTMPSSTVSGATVRSISVEHSGVAEKFVKYSAKYKYTVDIDYQLGTRKEPALKSMFEEPDTSADGIIPDSAVWNETQNSHSVDENTNQEEMHNEEVADLLGLGDE